jgi:recombinational DNA repair protein (RecF pathway)
MTEYFTDAIVLDKNPYGEADMRVVLYTREMGRVIAKVTSARKITSKLNGHLEPFMLSKVRLVQKNGIPQLIDALQFGRLPVSQLRSLEIVREITPDWEPDNLLWALLVSGKADEQSILKVLGFDSQYAACSLCESNDSLAFSTASLNYFCANCYNNH